MNRHTKAKLPAPKGISYGGTYWPRSLIIKSFILIINEPRRVIKMPK